MKKLLIALGLGAATLAATAPAEAQRYDRYDHNYHGRYDRGRHWNGGPRWYRGRHYGWDRRYYAQQRYYYRHGHRNYRRW